MEDVNQSSEMIQGSQEYDHLDLSRWMETLPSRLHHIPLNCLAIPGSHDSFTFFLNRSEGVAPDEPQWMKRAAEYLGSCVKRIIYNWSSVQSLNVTEQLASGVRYFDIRVATKSDSCDPPGTQSESGMERKDVKLFCVHGLYGLCIDECLESVASYLEDHGREIVVLDFNHFYEVDCEVHHGLIRKIRERFGSKLCPVHHDLREVSLRFLWHHGYQLIVLYHHCLAHHFHFLWPGCRVQSPWPGTDDVRQLLDRLEENYEVGRREGDFYVTQGILTPTTMFILKHLNSTLKETLAQMVVGPFLNWIRGKAVGRNGLNICIIDCVDLSGFTEAVVAMNYNHRDHTAE